jgi:hypothetical protein
MKDKDIVSKEARDVRQISRARKTLTRKADEDMEMVIGRWLGPYFRNSRSWVQHLVIGSGPILASLICSNASLMLTSTCGCNQPGEAIRYINVHIEIMI